MQSQSVRVEDDVFPVWRPRGIKVARGIIHGYLSGDGHFKPQRDRMIAATSIRSSLSIGIRDALASLGYGWATLHYKPAGIRCGRNEREAWTLILCGSGVDVLSDECGKPHPRRKIAGKQRRSVENGYVWNKITRIAPLGIMPVVDITVDHDDHSYCLPHAATHNSEVAYWKEAERSFLSSMQAASHAKEIYIESTANGNTGYFQELYWKAKQGVGDFEALFLAWFEMEEYQLPPPKDFVPSAREMRLVEKYHLSDAQLMWRRWAIENLCQGDEDLFHQEYPSNDEEAFLLSGRQAIPKGDMEKLDHGVQKPLVKGIMEGTAKPDV